MIGIQEAAVTDSDGFEIALEYALEPLEGEVSEQDRPAPAPIKSHYGVACAAGYEGPRSSDDEVWLRMANHSANDRGAQSDVGNPGLL